MVEAKIHRKNSAKEMNRKIRESGFRMYEKRGTKTDRKIARTPIAPRVNSIAVEILYVKIALMMASYLPRKNYGNPIYKYFLSFLLPHSFVLEFKKGEITVGIH